jgi:serine/threonine-protein kinase
MSDSVSRLNAALEGRYRIERELGEGGMATVYLADDLKHERKVALKVLKPELAAVVGAERFLAEIKTTANLTHPHILPLHDSGEADGFLFYVMPFVEGETLRERLDGERQLPVDQAVRLARDLAEALDYAHQHGVIHRDIKPANVLMQQGQPVISDFGIALAVGSAGGGARLTETGLSVGTPYYMSPEQATGDRVVGPQSDTFALACVLFEMLVGEPPYPGSTAQAVLGKIIAGGPVSAREHRSSVPVHVDAAIRRALEKLPADRFAAASDFGRALGDASFRYGDDDAAGLAAASGTSWRRRFIAMSVVAVAALGWATISTVRPRAESATPAQVVRFALPVHPTDSVYLGHHANARWGRPATTTLAVSPDGNDLVYGGWQRDSEGQFESALYLRRLDQESPTRIPGTEGGSVPFFSPEGDWLAFFSGNAIRRVSLTSGDVETLVLEGANPRRGASWSEDNVIFFVDTDGQIRRVARGGGESVVVREAPAEEGVRIYRPRTLPGGRFLLFDLVHFLGQTAQSEIRTRHVGTGEEWAAAGNAFDARYVGEGRLLFMREGILMATLVDVESGRTQGVAIPVLDDVMHGLNMPNTGWTTGAGQFALSGAGHLAYVPGGIFPERSRAVVRISPGRGEDVLDVEPREYARIRVSPDGRSLALVAGNRHQGYRLFVHDLDRGVTRRLPTGPVSPPLAVWSPDGTLLGYRGQSGDSSSLSVIAASGGSPPEVLIPDASSRTLAAWAPTGEVLYYDWPELWSLDDQGERLLVAEGAPSTSYPAVSPDGRWLAYSTTETGRYEVYVRPYPGPGAPTLVSAGGGLAPAWGRDGRTLYFRASSSLGLYSIMSVEVSLGETFRVGTPMTVFDPWTYNASIPFRAYDTAPDGTLVGLRGEASTRDAYAVGQIHVILNFDTELRRRFDELEGVSP